MEMLILYQYLKNLKKDLKNPLLNIMMGNHLRKEIDQITKIINHEYSN
jgi:hypothetical protein